MFDFCRHRNLPLLSFRTGLITSLISITVVLHTLFKFPLQAHEIRLSLPFQPPPLSLEPRVAIQLFCASL
jgi:hypothetical protein